MSGGVDDWTIADSKELHFDDNGSMEEGAVQEELSSQKRVLPQEDSIIANKGQRVGVLQIERNSWERKDEMLVTTTQRFLDNAIQKTLQVFIVNAIWSDLSLFSNTWMVHKAQMDYGFAWLRYDEEF
ncbi:hypothetical protein NDU88_003536 [Pleurodeles waltl]|uniref:Uncharacterized protein n=1 Tax=Pleurodeles waltl TaxID=8319 RepID=A0AAV7M6K5_PLEWA|nr:hypothetical protein NDU88_003536 [Pleurodeles waltl]